MVNDETTTPSTIVSGVREKNLQNQGFHGYGHRSSGLKTRVRNGYSSTRTPDCQAGTRY